MLYAGYPFPYGSPLGCGHTQTHSLPCLHGLNARALTHPTSILDTAPPPLLFPHMMYCNPHVATIHTHQTHTPLSYQTAATSALSRPSHSCSPRLSKRPISPPSKDHPDMALPKRPRSFHSNTQYPSQSMTYQSCETYSQSPTILLVCAVCLGRHKHSMPVIFCVAKCTWDDQFDTFIKRFNKVLQVRETGATLCSLWQHNNGCFEKHNSMHLCSGCGALTHGASKCPHVQKVPSTNSL